MHYGGEWLENWRCSGRVCSPDVFEIYFRLAVPKNETPNSEMEAILNLAKDQDAFKEALQKLNEDGKIVKFLERTEGYTKDFIPEDNIQNIVSVLMDIGDTFPESTGGMFEFGIHVKFRRIGYQLTHRLKDQSKRYEIYKSAFENAENSIYTIVHEVVSLGFEHGKLSKSADPEDQRTVNATKLEDLEKLAITKIEELAKHKPLSKSPYLRSILYSWKNLTEAVPQSLNQYLSTLIESDEGIVDFVTAFQSKTTSHGMGDYVGREDWRIDLDRLEEFVPAQEVELRIRSIVKSDAFNNLNEKQQRGLQLFLDTFDGKIKDSF